MVLKYSSQNNGYLHIVLQKTEKIVAKIGKQYFLAFNYFNTVILFSF